MQLEKKKTNVTNREKTSDFILDEYNIKNKNSTFDKSHKKKQMREILMIFLKKFWKISTQKISKNTS